MILLATAVMPPVVENELGKLEFRNESAICVPLIDEASRKIMDKYLVETYGGGAYGVNAPVETWYLDDGAPNYGPWWWLWSADYVEKMLTTCGLELVTRLYNTAVPAIFIFAEWCKEGWRITVSSNSPMDHGDAMSRSKRVT